MNRYTANYCRTNNNFAILNAPKKGDIESRHREIVHVLKNIIQRGLPTLMSKYLQQQLKISELSGSCNTGAPLYLIDRSKPDWSRTIKGHGPTGDYPAKTFFDRIPSYFSDYKFIQQLVLPEALITDIIETGSENFKEQRVDFCLPQARLVIEIDGEQHRQDSYLDRKRGQFLSSHRFMTTRITAQEIKNPGNALQSKLHIILNRLKEFSKELQPYKDTFENSRLVYGDQIVQENLRRTAICRFQILVLHLLENAYFNLNETAWRLNILQHDIREFARLAMEDLFIYLGHLCALRKIDFKRPELILNTCSKKVDFIHYDDYLNIDFSLLKRWDDQSLMEANTIFVRTDYFDDKDYFELSSCGPVKYEIEEEKDRDSLNFFLKNIFDKEDFREGQLGIIANALRREDTIGVLPTGVGKSLCYQLCALLQPAVSFVISPLRSLMIDQKENLDRFHFTRTAFISSDQKGPTRDTIQNNYARGKYIFIWISPERLQIQDFREYLKAVNSKYQVAYAIIDEVHCLSEWGHDFRTSYLNLAKTTKKYCPNARFLGLTATASQRVHKDIKAEFSILEDNIKSLISFDRPELTFTVRKCPSPKKLSLVKDLIKEFDGENGINQSDNGERKAAIIFTPHVNGPYGCYEITNRLSREYSGKVKYFSGEVPKGFSASSGGEYEKYKLQVQKAFKDDVFPLLVATKAFGMGIDKPNINLTVHYGIPPSIESFYQEAGRAGRHPDKAEKAKSQCCILFSDETKDALKSDVFHLNTKSEEIISLMNQIPKDFKNDICRMLFFFTNSFKGIDQEYESTVKVASLHIPNSSVAIGWSDAKAKTDTEKAIYRLSLMNIVEDYTIDFNSKQFSVRFREVNDQSLFAAISSYIRKYDDKCNVESGINNTAGDKYSKKCIRYLIEWIYENIAYERRQAIKGIADLCRDFKNPEDFKKKIVSYFEVTDITQFLQFISERPDYHKQWFDVLEIFIKSPDEAARITAAESVKIKLQRFLESYKLNTGLNFVSGFVRLCLNDYDDNDGRHRFESALEQIATYYNDTEKHQILINSLRLGSCLDMYNKCQLSESLLKFYKGAEYIVYGDLRDLFSLNVILKINVDRLKTVNGVLYGEYTATQQNY